MFNNQNHRHCPTCPQARERWQCYTTVIKDSTRNLRLLHQQVTNKNHLINWKISPVCASSSSQTNNLNNYFRPPAQTLHLILQQTQVKIILQNKHREGATKTIFAVANRCRIRLKIPLYSYFKLLYFWDIPTLWTGELFVGLYSQYTPAPKHQ